MDTKDHGKPPPRLAVTCLLLPLFSITLLGKDPILKPEELVARHLDSIGKPEARAAIKTRATSGTARCIYHLQRSGQLGGQSNVFSDGRKLMIGMYFDAIDYPAELMAFDGDHVTVSQTRPGVRSEVGQFIYSHDVLVKEGILAGVMSTAWALLDVPGRRPKLGYAGLRNVDGRQVHELSYRAQKGAGDLQISLYFDRGTFRHVATIAKLTQLAGMGLIPETSSGYRDTIYKIKEDYSDFKEVDALTLPHTYKLVYTMEGQNRTTLMEYGVLIEKMVHNQPMDPTHFSVR